MSNAQNDVEVVCIGAGPAGLTAAYLLTKSGRKVTVLEADPHYVGGISRTVKYKGFHIDIGGHRFFSKSKAVVSFWREILGKDFLERKRISRILYDGKFFTYPLRPIEALMKLGWAESLLAVGSYLKTKLGFRSKKIISFEDAIVSLFGRRLFKTFFQTYTEKIWGMPCSEISADWAAQRIDGLSALTIFKHALNRLMGKKRNRVKTMVENFWYPRKGPGMLWEETARRTEILGGNVRSGCTADAYSFNAALNQWTVSFTNEKNQSESITCKHVICSAPMRETASIISPALITNSEAEHLNYRDFLVVVLIVKDLCPLKDNWIYIHDPKLRVGRIQIFKNWSEEMVPDKNLDCIGMEYFCNESDEMWSKSDEELIAIASREFRDLKLTRKAEVIDATVIKQLKAYPVYDHTYSERVAKIRAELESTHPNFHLVGRNGMHKYNNQDHSMMTAMLTVENILAGKKIYDVWRVNHQAEYLEAGTAEHESSTSGYRLVPLPV